MRCAGERVLDIAGIVRGCGELSSLGKEMGVTELRSVSTSALSRRHGDGVPVQGVLSPGKGQAHNKTFGAGAGCNVDVYTPWRWTLSNLRRAATAIAGGVDLAVEDVVRSFSAMYDMGFNVQLSQVNRRPDSEADRF